ncbi:uncharacterized protein NPIL_568521 [Nephila pilipes]|uniref:Uncharacterized protein n=1 Tax=Nephila pilipes TaxID=299642 RepID=A0A8X6MQP5_NEPPI|nr:uncharacterized protein NPIL_568521 [Nephila pilipes]
MLESINNIDIERRIVIEKATQIEIHGFSDALERCFGAVVYCRSFSSTGETMARLVTSKSRVSPVKKPYNPKVGIVCCSLTIKVSEKSPCCNKTGNNRILME